jgi:hypothetical protein
MQYHAHNPFATLLHLSRRMPTARIRVLKPQYHRQYHDRAHQAYNTPGRMLVVRLPIHVLQMLVGLYCMAERLLNVEVNSIYERALVDDQLIQLPVDCCQLVYRFD